MCSTIWGESHDIINRMMVLRRIELVLCFPIEENLQIANPKSEQPADMRLPCGNEFLEFVNNLHIVRDEL